MMKVFCNGCNTHIDNDSNLAVEGISFIDRICFSTPEKAFHLCKKCFMVCMKAIDEKGFHA